MKYAATALLLSLGSDPTIDSKRIRTVLESVGIEPENDKLEHFVERLGKNQLDDVSVFFGDTKKKKTYFFFSNIFSLRFIR